MFNCFRFDALGFKFQVYSSLFTIHCSLFTSEALRFALLRSVRRALPLRARGLRAPCASLLIHDAKLIKNQVQNNSSPQLFFVNYKKKIRIVTSRSDVFPFSRFVNRSAVAKNNKTFYITIIYN